MATQSPQLTPDIADISARLLGEREVSPRARTLARAIGDVLPGKGVNIYLFHASDTGEEWIAQATFGDGAIPDPVVASGSGALGTLAQQPKSLVFSGDALVRELYAHINVRRTLRGLAYLPLLHDEQLIGAIEILGFDDAITELQLGGLRGLAEIGATALVSAQAYEEERNNALASITRLTQLYDVEKVFSSTLEMEELLPFIGSKIRE